MAPRRSRGALELESYGGKNITIVFDRYLLKRCNMNKHGGYIHEKGSKGSCCYCHIEYLLKSSILVRYNFCNDGNCRAHTN